VAIVPEADTILAFAAASLLFAVVPGPAVLYIVTRSVAQGRRAGLASVLGVATGTLVHVLFAALGLSAVLMSSATAFTVVKYLGAAYLVYLGITKMLRSAQRVGGSDVPRRQPLARAYRQGALVSVLNPKTALFFLAFLPQFVDPARGSVTLQLGILGALLVMVSIVSDSGYAMLTGTAGDWLRSRGPGFGRRQQLVSGGIYVGLGLTAAFADGRPAAK
jgi:threonine/homoserine/homoserine lactone efflux protein